MFTFCFSLEMWRHAVNTELCVFCMKRRLAFKLRWLFTFSWWRLSCHFLKVYSVRVEGLLWLPTSAAQSLKTFYILLIISGEIYCSPCLAASCTCFWSLLELEYSWRPLKALCSIRTLSWALNWRMASRLFKSVAHSKRIVFLSLNSDSWINLFSISISRNSFYEYLRIVTKSRFSLWLKSFVSLRPNIIYLHEPLRCNKTIYLMF